MDPEENTTAPAGNKYRTIKVAVVAIVLLLPIFLIYFKWVGTSDLQDQSTTTPQAVDLSALENAAKENPSFNNLIALSIAYINNNKADKSIDPLVRAITLNPKSAIAYNDLGVAYNTLHQYQKGMEACAEALAIDSTFELAKNNLKYAQDELAKLESADKEMESTPKELRTVDFYINYGLRYYQSGNYDKSIQVWTKVFELDKRNVIALNNIGSAFMMKKQYDDAIALFKKALEFEPTNQLTQNNLKWGMDAKAKAK